MVELTPVLELILRDASGSQAAVSFHLQYGSTVEAATAQAIAFVAVVLPLSGCVLVGIRITYRMRPEVISAAVSGSTILRAGAFIFRSEVGDNFALVTVPGIMPDVFETDGPGAGYIIDMLDPGVEDFIVALMGMDFRNPFNVSCTVVVDAYLQSRT